MLPSNPPVLGCGNYELLSHLDLVWIIEMICLGNHGILICVSVVALADLGEVIARLHRVGLIALTKFNVMFQVFIVGIDGLDRIPDAVLARL